MVSVGYFATLTGSFGALKSSGDALEAQKVAEIESNKLKFTDYDSLNSKVQQGKWVDAPDNPGWQYFVTIGNEKVIDGDNKQRIAEVKVRRKGDEESRFSTAVPIVSSDGGGGGKFQKLTWTQCGERERRHAISEYVLVSKAPSDGLIWARAYQGYISLYVRNEDVRLDDLDESSKKVGASHDTKHWVTETFRNRSQWHNTLVRKGDEIKIKDGDEWYHYRKGNKFVDVSCATSTSTTKDLSFLSSPIEVYFQPIK